VSALRQAFPLPALAAQRRSGGNNASASDAVSAERDPGANAGPHTAPPSALAPSPSVTVRWSVSVVQSMFEAFRTVVRCGDAALAERAALYAAVLDFVASEEHWPLLEVESLRAVHLSALVLRCWTQLADLQMTPTQRLVQDSQDSAQLLLLECALWYVYTATDGDRDLALLSAANELLTVLLGHIVKPQADRSQDFWLRYTHPEHQRRAIWAVVTACRSLSPGLAVGADYGPRDLLLQLSGLLENVTTEVHLPHARHASWRTLSRTTCTALLSTLQHEGEVKDLLRQHAPSRNWVRKALTLVQKGDQLRSMMTAAASVAGKSHSDSASNIPGLILDASAKLGDVEVWLETLAVLLQTALRYVPATQEPSAPREEVQELLWVTALLELVAARPVSIDSEGKVSDKKLLTAATAAWSLLVALAPYCTQHTAADSAVRYGVAIARQLLKVESRVSSSQAKPVTSMTRNGVLHALLGALCAAQSPSSSVGAPPSCLEDLWELWVVATDGGDLTNLPLLSHDAWCCLVKLNVESRRRSTPQQLNHRAALLLLFLRLITSPVAEESSYISHKMQTELLALLHREHTEQCASAQRLQRQSTSGRKRARSTPTTPTSQSNASSNGFSLAELGGTRREAFAALLTSTLEGLLYHAEFSTRYPLKEQRALVTVLGELYHQQHGLLLFGTPSPHADEGQDDAVNYNFVPEVVAKLFRFTTLCSDLSWVGRAEVRAALLQLSRAPVLVAYVQRSATTTVLLRLLHNDFSALAAREQLAQACRAGVSTTTTTASAELQTVARDTYAALLDAGVTSNEVYESDSDVESADNRADHEVSTRTTLNQEFDLGTYFTDPRGAFMLTCALHDLVSTPLRRTSWLHLTECVMESYNSLCDELQKVCLADKIPMPSNPQWFTSASVYPVLFPFPTASADLVDGDGTSGDAGGGEDHSVAQSTPNSNSGRELCIWHPSTTVAETTMRVALDAAAAALKRASGLPLPDLFSESLARETLCNRQGAEVTEEAYETHLKHLCFLLALRDAAFAVVCRLRVVLTAVATAPTASSTTTDVPAVEPSSGTQTASDPGDAVSSSSNGNNGAVTGDADQIDAELYALVASNALKSRPKDHPQRPWLKASMADWLSQGTTERVVYVSYCVVRTVCLLCSC
jgi:hypothetical protein